MRAKSFSVYPRTDTGTYWVNFRVNGKRIRRNTLVALTSDKQDAERAAATIWLEAGGAASAPPGAAEAAVAHLSMADMWAMFLEEDVPRRVLGDNRDGLPMSPEYARGCASDVKLLAPHFASPQEITDKKWRDVMVKLRKHSGRRSGLKWSSIAVALATLRHFVRFCVTKGILASAPELSAPRNKAIKAEESKRRDMTADERDRFLADLLVPRSREFGSERDNMLRRRAHRVYTILFYTALRRGELEKMTPRWINLRMKRLTLPALQTKTRMSDQEIFLHPVAEKALVEEMELNTEQRGSHQLDTPIFGPFNYQHLFWLSIKRCGIDEIGLTAHHVTRHTAITMVCESAGNLQEARAVSRHTDLRMLGRYWKDSARLSEKALGRL